MNRKQVSRIKEREAGEKRTDTKKQNDKILTSTRNKY